MFISWSDHGQIVVRLDGLIVVRWAERQASRLQTRCHPCLIVCVRVHACARACVCMCSSVLQALSILLSAPIVCSGVLLSSGQVGFITRWGIRANNSSCRKGVVKQTTLVYYGCRKDSCVQDVLGCIGRYRCKFC